MGIWPPLITPSLVSSVGLGLGPSLSHILDGGEPATPTFLSIFFTELLLNASSLLG